MGKIELSKSVHDAAVKLQGEPLDAYEVYGLEEESLVVEVKRQMVDTFRRSRVGGIAIRTVSEGRMGWSATFDLSEKAVAKAIKQSIAAMKAVGPSPESVIAPQKDASLQFAEPVGRELGGIADEDKIAIALSVESAAVANDSRISRVRKPRYREWTMRAAVANSNGVNISGMRSMAGCELTAIATDENSSECAYEYEFLPLFEDLDAEAVARRAAVRACMKLGATKAGKGYMPAALDSRAAAGILHVLAPSFFADNVQRGKSSIANALNQKKYSPFINIVDDGLLPRGLGSFPFDGEGTPCGSTVLVRNGIVSAWLYDAPRAARDNALSTGNCHRGDVDRAPEIGVTNCFVKAGTTPSAALFSDVKNGILITDLMGLHTANVITGDFSLGAEGFLIEDGRATSPVRGITVAGNVHELFSKVVNVGDDLKFYGQFGAPSILVEGLVIGG